MKNQIYRLLLATAVVMSHSITVLAQNTALKLPIESQQATVTQRVGVTDISIVYHRPLVNGRKIWGALVPYNIVWRAGANENTTISFTNDVVIEGKPLSAGTYGFHTIPGENEWIVIFSKKYTSWGSFSYKESEDALRIKVKPEMAAFTECLTYEFTTLKPNSAVLSLRWEKLSIAFTIEIEPAVVVQNIRKQLESLTAPTWANYYNAADYCYKMNVNTEDALKWIDESVKMEQRFRNLRLKAKLLEKTGNKKEADEIMKNSFTVASENDLNLYGYELLGNQKIKEAIEIFKMNVKSYPDSWNAYDSLAEAYEKDGDKKQAIANYKIASKKAPEDQKQRLKEVLDKL